MVGLLRRNCSQAKSAAIDAEEIVLDIVLDDDQAPLQLRFDKNSKFRDEVVHRRRLILMRLRYFVQAIRKRLAKNLARSIN